MSEPTKQNAQPMTPDASVPSGTPQERLREKLARIQFQSTPAPWKAENAETREDGSPGNAWGLIGGTGRMIVMHDFINQIDAEAIAELRNSLPEILAALAPLPLATEPQSIDIFWREVALGWSIESREWFESNYAARGYSDPVTMAVHHIWKRETKARSTEPSAAAQPSAPACDKIIGCRECNPDYPQPVGSAVPPSAEATPSVSHAINSTGRDYVIGPSLAAEWSDKPHRLVYDLTAELTRLRSAVVRLTEERDGLRTELDAAIQREMDALPDLPTEAAEARLASTPSAFTAKQVEDWSVTEESCGGFEHPHNRERTRAMLREFAASLRRAEAQQIRRADPPQQTGTRMNEIDKLRADQQEQG